MSGRNWLERDPSQSPGLQRIKEAQQAAAAAKAQTEQQAREAEIAAQEAEQKRLEMIAKINQKTAQILPVLEEVKNFANATKTFPLGIISDLDVRITDPSRVVVTPEIADGNGLGEIQLRYGFEGVTYYKGYRNDFVSNSGGEEKTPVLFGILLKVEPDKVLLFQKRVKKVLGHGPYTKIEYEGEWRQLPNDERQLKHELADAFHDPLYLGAGYLPLRREVDSQLKPQASTGITGLVKGLLGLK